MSDVKNLGNTLFELSKSIKINKPTAEEMEEAHKSYIKWQKENQNNLSYWFPKVRDIMEWGGISVPKTKIIEVPEDVMESCFMERSGDYEKIRTWVHTVIMPELFGANSTLFMKNGCFSNKFNFDKSCKLDGYDEESVTRQFIHLQAASLAYDTGGNMEIVFREYIYPPLGTPTIYNGMPLRPEIRLFYDFDKHEYLYSVNYWDWDYCHERICENEEDKIVYTSYYPTLKGNYEYLRKQHLPQIINALRRVMTLNGIWSVDFILDRTIVYLIDMANAWQSAYWDPDWQAKDLGKL